jgi:hypothetical protein
MNITVTKKFIIKQLNKIHTPTNPYSRRKHFCHTSNYYLLQITKNLKI